MGHASLISKHKEGESLLLYLAILAEVVSAILIRKDEGTQLPMYYVSNALSST